MAAATMNRALHVLMLAAGLPALVGASQVDAQQQPTSDAVIERALESANQSSSSFERSQRIADIALLQAQRGDIEGALANARLVSALEHSKLLRKIVGLLADNGDFAAALKAANSIDASRDHDSLAGRIAEAQAFAGQIAAAIDTAKTIADPDAFSDAILSIVAVQARGGDVAGAGATARGSGYDRENRQAALGVAMAEAIGGDLDGATKAAAALGNIDQVRRAFNRIASEFLDLRQFEHALVVLDRARDLDPDDTSPWGGEGLRMMIAISMAQGGDRKGGDAVAATIRDGGSRAVALASNTWLHVQAGDNAAARSDALAAMDAALTSTEPLLRSSALQRAAEAAAAVGEIDRAIAFAKTAAGENDQMMLTEVLSAVAGAAARVGNTEGAAAALTAVGDKSLAVCWVMLSIANGYATAGAIDSALLTTRKLKESCAPFDEVALASIAAAQANQGDIAGALATADQIVTRPESRAQALTEIATAMRGN